MINPIEVFNCYGDNFIGIRGYCDSESKSGYYLNDLVTIDLKGMAFLATSEDGNGNEFFKRIQRNAITETASDFLEGLHESAKIDFQFGTTEDCIELPANRILKMTSKDALQRVYIDRAEINEGDNIYVMDSQGNSEVVVVDDTYKRIDFKGIGDVVYLYVNDAPISLTNDLRECKGCKQVICSCACFDSEEVENVSLIGSDQDNVFYIRCECSYDELICSMRNLLARPIYYHLAGLFSQERWLSTNLDPFVTGNKEEAERLYHEYLNGYEERESKYKKSLNAAIRAADSQLKKIGTKCLNCVGVKRVELKF